MRMMQCKCAHTSQEEGASNYDGKLTFVRIFWSIEGHRMKGLTNHVLKSLWVLVINDNNCELIILYEIKDIVSCLWVRSTCYMRALGNMAWTMWCKSSTKRRDGNKDEKEWRWCCVIAREAMSSKCISQRWNPHMPNLHWPYSSFGMCITTNMAKAKMTPR